MEKPIGKINIISITVDDVDYSYTVLNLLETMKQAIIESPNTYSRLSMSNLCYIIKQGIKFHYIAFQNPFKTGITENTTATQLFVDVENYITANIKVYINDDAEKLLKDPENVYTIRFR